MFCLSALCFDLKHLKKQYTIEQLTHTTKITIITAYNFLRYTDAHNDAVLQYDNYFLKIINVRKSVISENRFVPDLRKHSTTELHIHLDLLLIKSHLH